MKNLVMVVNERMHVGDNISIVVRDQDGNPVSVNIRVTEPDGVTYEFRTDINGMALTQLKKEGHYRIRAEKDRYNATEKTVVVSSLGYQTRYLVCFAVLLAVLIAVAYWIYRRTGST
jgi:hypothetical protein